MKIKLTKLKDNKFHGKHPNGINEGFVREGECNNLPRFGMPFIILTTTRYFYTSTITKVNDDNTFETLNSTYKLEILE